MAAWFKPKRYGIGASPAGWRGWLLVILFVVVVELDLVLLTGVLRWIIPIVLTVVLWLAAWLSTRPWRWRWGDDA